MTTLRSSAASVLLNNGTVLETGGYFAPWTVNSSAEVYNPASNGWTAVPSMSQARENQTATLLPNGTVLVAGGDNVTRATGAVDQATAEIYTPAK